MKWIEPIFTLDLKERENSHSHVVGTFAWIARKAHTPGTLFLVQCTRFLKAIILILGS